LSPQLLIWLMILVVLEEKSLNNLLSFIVRFSNSLHGFCSRMEMAFWELWNSFLNISHASRVFLIEKIMG
jgi:hypothetical protein